jgi:hypothetical protein
LSGYLLYALAGALFFLAGSSVDDYFLLAYSLLGVHLYLLFSISYKFSFAFAYYFIISSVVKIPYFFSSISSSTTNKVSTLLFIVGLP